ncbi:MAG: (Fe-S)-binding protein [Gemmatimonadota bacterium]
MPSPAAAHLIEAHEDLLACVHCGFCLPVCPTYDVTGDENDGPRGRISLMRAAAEARARPAGVFARHIDRCLGCRACESACPAGVRFGLLLERARADRASFSLRSRLGSALERAVLAALTGRRLSRIVYGGARLLRGAPGVRFLARRAPGRAGRAAAFLAATRPPGWRRPAATEAGPSPSVPPGAPSFVLLEGCVMRGLFAHVHASARRALAAWGFIETAAPGQGCCGALHAHAGRPEEARRLARRNIEAFERSGARWIVADSAGCGAALRDYASWLERDEAWSDRAESLATRVRDVTELVADGFGPSAGAQGRGPALRPVPGRAAYDAPCHLLHGQGVREAPLEALRRVPGLDVESLPSSERCCGGAGTYNLKRPGLSERVLSAKLDEIAAAKVDWIVTGNPGCIMQIGAGLGSRGLATPVLHPIELLDRALERTEAEGAARA